MTNLHQVIAAEKGIKSRTHSFISDLYRVIQKEPLFLGISRVYSRKNEDGEELPPEKKAVHVRCGDVIRELRLKLSDLYDITAQKDISNTTAVADVIVDNEIILEDIPVSYLLFLEKHLTDLRTFVSNLPELDGAEHWNYDASDGYWKSEVTRTHRTEKVHEPVVKYPATDKHPAQTEMITRDRTVGYWDTTKISGAIPKTEKEQIVGRVDNLILAVKEARERANDSEVDDKPKFSEVIFSYVFGK